WLDGPFHLLFESSLTDPGGVEDRAKALNHPALWHEVLKKYPLLKLNLAHMGVRSTNNLSEKYEWSNLIVEMMLCYENLYTDLSCRTDSGQLQMLWMMAKNEDTHCKLPLSVTDRVLFGTDFWLSMQYEDVKAHLKCFDSTFAEEPNSLARLKQINPARFLNLPNL
ncbi:MAG: hypothetical protein ACRC9Q_04015, partial [Bacteroidales bacterium]